jgi:DNA-directed RNA polymerase subunit RPC12/RpoP
MSRTVHPRGPKLSPTLNCPYCNHEHRKNLTWENRWMLFKCDGCGKTFEARMTGRIAGLRGMEYGFESRSRWRKPKRRDRGKAKAEKARRKRSRK